MISQKGEAMWWIIIGAVLALIVLIVMVVMFTNKGSSIEKGLNACSGICTASGEKQCPVGTQSSSAFDCGITKGVCCIGFATECTKQAESTDCDVESGESCDAVGDKSYCVAK